MSALKVALYIEEQCAKAGGVFHSTDPEIATANSVSLGTVKRAIRGMETLEVVRRTADKSTYRINSDTHLVTHKEGDGYQTGIKRVSDGYPKTNTRNGFPLETTTFLSTSKKEGRKEDDVRREATQLPDDWKPDAKSRAFAIANKVDPDLLAADHCNYWWSRGEAREDWQGIYRRSAIQCRQKGRYPYDPPKSARPTVPWRTEGAYVKPEVEEIVT